MQYWLVALAVVGGLAVVLGIGFLILRAASTPRVISPSLNTDGEGHFDVLGKRVQCAHCGSDRFAAREILLNTWLLSLLNLEWLDAGSTVLTCHKCGRLTWFSQADADEQ
ncbi:MAG: hypothetical protein KJO31_07325 [Gammaproteobacteria bacterium]|nr:hypothetical protein [Gammaproteobacteria bacterium]